MYRFIEFCTQLFPIATTATRAGCGYRRAAWFTALVLGSGAATSLHAQQFVVDDAAVVDAGACQLEAWHGGTASWILPACQPFRNLELTAGLGLHAGGEGGRDPEYVLQAKYLIRGWGPRQLGIGVVAGIGADPFTQVSGRRLQGVYAYVPATYALPLAGSDERLVLHANLGGVLEFDAHDDDAHGHAGHGHDHDGGGAHAHLTWGARADLLLPVAADRFTLIGELFGEDRLLPEFQVGLRGVVVPERLMVDISYGGHTQRGLAGAGWVVGVAWTPPAFF
jgi:hypothetical protein